MALNNLVKKPPVDDGGSDAGAPAWMVTFADLMTLLSSWGSCWRQHDFELD